MHEKYRLHVLQVMLKKYRLFQQKEKYKTGRAIGQKIQSGYACKIQTTCIACYAEKIQNVSAKRKIQEIVNSFHKTSKKYRVDKNQLLIFQKQKIQKIF